MNIIKKLILKNNDPVKYKDYKFISTLNKISTIQNEFGKINDNGYAFKHSGNCGDIIYAIPAIKALSKGKSIHLYLHLNQPASFNKSIKHPLNNVMLNENIYNMISPLLLSQENFTNCAIYNNQKIDFNLDLIRQYPIQLDRGNISRWYFLLFAVNYNLSQPWLTVPQKLDYSDTIIIARSERYHSPLINYSFLSKYPKVSFVGLKNEFDLMSKQITNLKFIEIDNFLQLASIIAGCKFFIGNQSFPFSLAEGLKVKRLLEVCYWCPNVSVDGDNGYDFAFQEQFEFLVDKVFYE